MVQVTSDTSSSNYRFTVKKHSRVETIKCHCVRGVCPLARLLLRVLVCWCPNVQCDSTIREVGFTYVKGFLHRVFNFALCFLNGNVKLRPIESPSARALGVKTSYPQFPKIVSSFRAKTPIFCRMSVTQTSGPWFLSLVHRNC